MRKHRCLLILLVLVCTALRVAAGPSDIAILATMDTAIADGAWSGTNQGNQPRLAVGHQGIEPEASRALIRFDLTQIRSDAQITRATLQLFCTGSSGDSDTFVTAYRITQDWTEMTATWNGMADSYAEAYDTTQISWRCGERPRYSYWDISELVQDWIDGTQPNYGVMLIGYEGIGDNLRQFNSREEPYGNEPWLLISWGVPIPPAIKRVYLPSVFKGTYKAE